MWRAIFVVGFSLFLAPLARAQGSDAARFADAPAVRDAVLSPDGNYVALIRRNPDGEHISVIDLVQHQERGIQNFRSDNGRLNWVAWKGNDRLLFSATAFGTAEGRRFTGTTLRSDDVEYRVTRIFAISRDGGEPLQMFQGQTNRLYGGLGSMSLISELSRDPTHVLIGAQGDDGYGVWRADVTTGRVEQLENGTADTVFYQTDGEDNVVIRTEMRSNWSGYRILRRAPGAREWTAQIETTFAAEATNSPDFVVLGAAPGVGRVYVSARAQGQDLAALYELDTTTGALGGPLMQGSRADMSSGWFNPATHELMVGCAFGRRLVCSAADSSLQAHLTAIAAATGNRSTVSLVDMSADGNVWLLRMSGPTDPGGFSIYDRRSNRLRRVGPFFPSVDASVLSPTEIVEYQSRDGTTLWAYVTARPGATGPRPMVVMPHGGPEARDYYGFDPWVQFLASRGYIVVQPNFRGGYGFGRNFADAGRGQWGRRMQDDVTDATQHMINSGRADRARICIVGASYGGYAALAGAALTPDLYRCVVSIAGVSDLLTMLAAEREAGRHSPSYEYWLRSIGNPNENREDLIAVSPARLTSRISAPVLLLHGEADDIVGVEQSELMQRAMQSAGKEVRFVRLPNSGHRWVEWAAEDRLLALQELDAFLRPRLADPN